MAVTQYRFSILTYDKCTTCMTPNDLIELLKAWRKHHSFAHICAKCESKLDFDPSQPYTICCKQFYFNNLLSCYPVHSIAIRTQGYTFMLKQLDVAMRKTKMKLDQDFLVIPDPIYWQVASTLVFEKVMKFVSGQPMTSRTKQIPPPSKSNVFYKQIQETPLNYGSLNKRSCGKFTFIRQNIMGKRSCFTMRGTIVPDASLEPNQIRLPDDVVDQMNLKGQYVALIRMPSLGPTNFQALIVTKGETAWPSYCIGVPIEILEAINGDFDGDECNIYILPSYQSQAECAMLLDVKQQMNCFVNGLKLSPSQDMLVAYYKFYDEIDFLPYKSPDLKRTLNVIYDLYGSQKTFECFNRMREFYLDAFQNRTCFGLTLEEMLQLREFGKQASNLEEFERLAKETDGCLVTQIKSKAKGSFEHLYQMFGSVGWQNGTYIKNSFWEGLTPSEAIEHAITATEALSMSGRIWKPGYGYTKSAFNLQGLTVNYMGQLVDGDVVVEKDVLNALHYTDVMTEDTFTYLVQNVLTGQV